MTTPTIPTPITKQQLLLTGMSHESPQTPLSPFSTSPGIGLPTSSLPPLSPTSPGSYGITPQEGHVHYYEGYMARRSSMLKRWKKRKPYAIVPGQQKVEVQKFGKTRKVLHSFPVQSPNVTIEPVNCDPKSDDFLTFRLIDSKTKKELDRYRTDDIVQMRHFMTSLGTSGFGIFSKKPPPTVEAKEAGIAPPKVHKTTTYYDDVLASLPTEFYFSRKPSGITITISAGAMPGPFSKPLPLYDPQQLTTTAKRRPWHDTFRPPVGPAVHVPLSMCYGEEVGLQKGQQAIWDPVLKACVVLDHNTKTHNVIPINDLRKAHRQPKGVTISEIKYGHGRPVPNFKYDYTLCKDIYIVQDAAKRARAREKPHGLIFDASGVHGMHGPNGRSAAPGVDGRPGKCAASKGVYGQDGSPGSHGNVGTQGSDGKDGTNASNVTLFLDGDSNNLKVTGSYTFNASLGGDCNQEVLFVNCRGGNGGKGGDGGNGGTGGDGGAGGDGAPGKKGWDNPNGTGGPGGPGGDGGTGGNGGRGGSGGIGGNGGNAGAGGTCVICTADPKLLVLVEVDALGGDAGIGGAGGKGGRGGKRGMGGQGGVGGKGGNGISRSTYTENRGSNVDHKTRTTRGPSGPRGRHGLEGNDGKQGRDAKSGSNGRSAPSGGIAWVVYSKQGTVLQQAGTRYEMEVKHYEITCENGDDVFEPNERVAINEVLMVNVGGLPLPAGAEVTMEKTKTDTINFEPIRYKLPEIQPGKSFKVPIAFYGRISDQPPPIEVGALEKKADFVSRVELIGRPFLKSFRSVTLPVQYPVKLKLLQCNENVGRGEVTFLTIQIENISSKPYGSCQGSAGNVGVQVHMDAQLIPIAYYGSENGDKLPYTVLYDPAKRDSLYVQVKSILPKETLTMQLAVQVDCNVELFDRCQWQVDLCLRGKVIEYNFGKIRISPIYVQRDPPGDILMVTGPDISLAAFTLWQRMFQVLGVSVDYWDTTRYDGLSQDNSTGFCHSHSWLGRYRSRMILYPYCNLNFLQAPHIVDHFHGDQAERPDLNSSMILVMNPTANRSVKFGQFQDCGDNYVLQHLVSVDKSLPLPKGGYGGMHMKAPTADPHIKWEQETLEKKEKENPSHAVSVFRRRSSIESIGPFKYSYGEVDLRRCPLKRSCKFLFVDGAGGSMSQIGVDDPYIHGSINSGIPLASNFGQLFLLSLYGLPVSIKLGFIKGTLKGDMQISFTLPNGLLLSLTQLSAICLSYEISDEVLGCPKTPLRANVLLKDIIANKSAYASKSELMWQLTDLIDKELQDRNKRADNAVVSQAVKEAKRVLSQIQQVVRESGRHSSKAKLPTLPGFLVLQDTLHIHRSHQHMVIDERWNLVSN